MKYFTELLEDYKEDSLKGISHLFKEDTTADVYKQKDKLVKDAGMTGEDADKVGEESPERTAIRRKIAGPAVFPYSEANPVPLPTDTIKQYEEQENENELIETRHLTGDVEKEVMKLKPHLSDFKKRYGEKKGLSVLIATATTRAKDQESITPA